MNDSYNLVNYFTSPVLGSHTKRKNDVLLFSGLLLIGIGTAFYVTVIGQLYVSEILLLTIFPFLLIKKAHSLQNRWIKRITFFGYLWFLGQIITDLIRSTPITDIARGLASIIVFLIAFLSLFLLISEDLNRIKFYIFGVCVGGFLQQFIQPSPYFSSEPWKFGYGPVVTLLVLLVLTSISSINYKKSIIPIIILFCLGGVSLYLDARSIGLFSLLTSLVLLLGKSKPFTKIFNKRINPWNSLLVFILLGGCTYGLINIYGTIADHGWLGNSVKQKYELQSSGSLGLILGGRSEILSSIRAVLDSPIIGHGSWAADKKYGYYLYDISNFGYDIPHDQIDYIISRSDLIPTHSHLFQNWVWSGILGAAFWVMILVLVLKSFVINLHYSNLIKIFVIYFTFASIWDIFFSPFGSNIRMEWALRLIIFITAISLPNSADKNHNGIE